MLYRERLTVPLAWWVLTGLFAASLVLAFGFYLGPVWGIGIGVACVAVMGAVFVNAAAAIRVDEDAVRVGRAVLELAYVGPARALDVEATRRRSGPEADARAYLVLRPYVSTVVELTVADADDPAPYWLVASRRPAELAAAVERARGSHAATLGG